MIKYCPMLHAKPNFSVFESSSYFLCYSQSVVFRIHWLHPCKDVRPPFHQKGYCTYNCSTNFSIKEPNKSWHPITQHQPTNQPNQSMFELTEKYGVVHSTFVRHIQSVIVRWNNFNSIWTNLGSFYAYMFWYLTVCGQKVYLY